MAGYLGTKAVLLSTTAADVTGNAEVGGDLTVGGNLTSTGIDDNASSTAITIDGSQNVGIGTSSPASEIHAENSAGNCGIRAISSTTGVSYINLGDTVDNNDGSIEYNNSSRYMMFQTANAERMRLDASGNLLVGKTSNTFADVGVGILAGGELQVTRSGVPMYLRRNGSDGDIVSFRKDGTTVGSIGVASSDQLYISRVAGSQGIKFKNGGAIPCNADGSDSDNDQDLGILSVRWDDIYATNGTIQTSDRNEKQDIDVLSDAEARVAVACKGLLRKFRWKDAVAEKGDDARIHFGIIAQDLQDAFTAEGLDAGRYAMFISNTWWETQTDVPAVAAVAEVLDDEGNVVTEAVEAKEAYTRTDTYETQAEAPEGATERTRLGVRYPELLAFIIGAM